jgi:integrase
MKRLRTNKRALLFAQVRAAWERAEKEATPIAIRDAFALVVAFFFGLRVSELISLRPECIEAVRLQDQSVAMKITFRQCKNRRSILMQHQPFTVACAHPLLIRAWSTFEKFFDYFDNTPVFHRVSGSTRDPLSRTWFADVIRAAAPGTTPHSARVGLATELWAAGKSIDVIMTAGRWTSAAAVLYVVGALEDQAAATRAIGDGLVYTGEDLRRIGASPEQFADHRNCPISSPSQWAPIAAALEDL